MYDGMYGATRASASRYRPLCPPFPTDRGAVRLLTRLLAMSFSLPIVLNVEVAQATELRSPVTTVSLQLTSAPQAEFAGYFVAESKGYYKRQGLNVEILSATAKSTPEVAVESGSAQFGIDWLAALLHAREAGEDLINIAQIFQGSGMRMISHKRLNIRTVKALKGHKVGVWPDGSEYQFFALLRTLKYPCNVKHFSCAASTGIKVEPETSSMAPFVNGQLDVSQVLSYDQLGLVTEQPPVGQGVPAKKLNILDYNKLGVGMLEDGLFGDQTWLAAHRAIAVGFLKATLKGWSWAVKNPTKAGKITYSYIPPTEGTSQAHQVYMAHAVASLVTYRLGRHPIGWMNTAAYKRTWKEAKLSGDIPRVPGRSAYDQTFWHAAVK